jgi:hypothetical protein
MAPHQPQSVAVEVEAVLLTTPPDGGADAHKRSLQAVASVLHVAGSSADMLRVYADEFVLAGFRMLVAAMWALVSQQQEPMAPNAALRGAITSLKPKLVQSARRQLLGLHGSLHAALPSDGEAANGALFYAAQMLDAVFVDGDAAFSDRVFVTDPRNWVNDSFEGGAQLERARHGSSGTLTRAARKAASFAASFAVHVSVAFGMVGAGLGFLLGALSALLVAPLWIVLALLDTPPEAKQVSLAPGPPTEAGVVLAGARLGRTVGDFAPADREKGVLDDLEDIGPLPRNVFDDRVDIVPESPAPSQAEGPAAPAVPPTGAHDLTQEQLLRIARRLGCSSGRSSND